MNLGATRHSWHTRYEQLLYSVNLPGRYAGGEFNVVRKELPGLRLRYGLAHPDLYDAGFGHPELNRLYAQLNRHSDVGAERVFLPDADLESALRTEGLPLFTLESHTPLWELHVVHLCIPRALHFVNVPAILELGGIPPRASDRGADHPLVLLSGPPALAPESVADFVDLVLVGETEDVMEALVENWRTLRAARLDRQELLLELARTLDGAFAPAFSRPAPERAGLPDPVIAARVDDFERAVVPRHPLVAGIRTVEDAIRVEIVRGIDPDRMPLDEGRNGWAALAPARPRSTSRLLDLLEAQYVATGHDEMVLAAPRPLDHPDLAGLIDGVRSRFRGLRVQLRVPGLALADQVALLGPPDGVSPKPLGGTPRARVSPAECSPALGRLRGIPVEPDAILEHAGLAYRQGFAGIEVHAVLGVPGETDVDAVAVGKLAHDLNAAVRDGSSRSGRVELCCAPWVPRPHSPHERECVTTPEAFESRLAAVRRGLGRRRDVRLRWIAPDHAALEAVLARGDRDLGAGLLVLARKGVRIRSAPGQAAVPEGITSRLLAAANRDPRTAFSPLPGGPDRLPWSHLRRPE